MRVPFIKMHGLGNDFIVLDGRSTSLPALNRETRAALAHRQLGIGCDQLVVLEPSAVAVARMRIYNPDGGEAEACGNASRAVALLLGGSPTLETAGRVIQARHDGNGIAVDMGAPRLRWEDIPLAYPMDTDAMPVGWHDLGEPAAVNIGNPHVVFFVDDVEAVPLERLGPLVEHDPLFPQGVNVNCAEVTGSQAIRLRVWERGAGLTRACGTGACAAAIAALRRKLVRSPVSVSLPGGDLLIQWDGQGTVTMIGPAAESFRGSFRLEDYT